MRPFAEFVLSEVEGLRVNSNAMSRSKLPRSLRKFIRMEKARIRRTIKDPAELARRMQELVEKYHSAA